MDFIEIIGLAAAAFTTLANIPQAAKIIRTQSTKSISAVTYSMLFTGLSLWVAYGFLKNDLAVILGNIVAVLLCGVILSIKLYMKFSDREEH